MHARRRCCPPERHATLVILSVHTAKRLAVRQINTDWIELTLSAPDWTEADPDVTLARSFKAFAVFGNRVLRVVHRLDGNDVFVTTAFFDRNTRR